MPPTIPPALTTAARVLRENLNPEDLAEITQFARSTITDARDYRFGDDPATLEEIGETLTDRRSDVLRLVPDDAPWWYLSFADPHRPSGQQFLGGVYVQGEEPRPPAPRPLDAVTVSHLIGANPGGEIEMLGPIPVSALRARVPPEQRHRLLTHAEIVGQQ